MIRQYSWETTRTLLLQLEVCNQTICLQNFNEEAQEIVSQTMEWLFANKLANGQMLKLSNELAHDFYFERLTWAGFELLESLRDEATWNKVLQNMEAQHQPIEIQSIQHFSTEYALHQAKQQLG